MIHARFSHRTGVQSTPFAKNIFSLPPQALLALGLRDHASTL
jgi:hypothetical protein